MNEGAIEYAVGLAIVTFPVGAIGSGRKLRVRRLERPVDEEVLVTIEIGVLAAYTSAKPDCDGADRKYTPEIARSHAPSPSGKGTQRPDSFYAKPRRYKSADEQVRRLASLDVSALCEKISRDLSESEFQMRGYELHAPDIVKSVQQRWLLSYWSRLRDGAILPPSATLDLDSIESCRDDLSVLDVVPHNGVHRFRIFDHGKNVGAMYAGQCAGKYLDETLPDGARAHTLETYEYVVQSGKPVFTVSQMVDADGRPVLYERLLLPLGDAEGRVVRILALLETISTEGRIDRRSLMTGPMPPARYVVKAELQLAPV